MRVGGKGVEEFGGGIVGADDSTLLLSRSLHRFRPSDGAWQATSVGLCVHVCVREGCQINRQQEPQ